jgi:hypothetical protein
MSIENIPEEPVLCKSFLVDLGLCALTSGHWRLVQAITATIHREGLARE